MKKSNARSDIINSLFPFLLTQDALDRAVRIYFFICFFITALGVLAYLSYSTVLARPDDNWLGLTMLLWLPVTYSMQNTFRPVQDDVQARGPLWFAIRMAAGLCATLAGVYAMMQIREPGQNLVTRIGMVPLLSYGIALWNVQVLIALLNWKLLDKGGIVAAIIGTLLGMIWFKLET